MRVDARSARALPALTGITFGVVYGVMARLVFATRGASTNKAGAVFGTLSVAFLFFVPVALGALTVALAPPRSWLYWIFTPWLSCLFLMAAVMALAWEGMICVVLASPIFLTMSSLGGVLVGLVRRSRDGAAPPAGTAAALALLPFLLAPAENRIAPVEENRTVETTVRIDADAATVWKNVARVSEIHADEEEFSPFHLIGIPRPLEAVLSADGVGALRTARFRGGIVFNERVTEWRPGEALGFTIAVDPASIAPGVLDEHVRVGSRHFDVYEGRFRIEADGAGVALHLVSRHRLATRFNAYAGLWTDAIMRDLQVSICRIIKRRCERRPPAGPPTALTPFLPIHPTS